MQIAANDKVSAQGKGKCGEAMKFIIKRSGSYTVEVWQEVVVEADSAEEAEALAWDADGEAQVVCGDAEEEWNLCEERDVSEAIEESEHYARQQFSFGAAFAPVFVKEESEQW